MASDTVTTSISRLSLITGSGLAATTVVNGEMEKLMECPVCKEIPLPPIFTCVTGHIICNECLPKLKKCALCKLKYTNSRNFALESMVQAAKFYCENHPKGCNVIGGIDELIKHQQICTFSRPLKCYKTSSPDCNGTLLYISDYVDHLKKVHHLRPLNHAKDKENTFIESYALHDWGEETLKLNKHWKDCILDYEDKAFITRVFSRGPLFYFGCIFIGEETEAVKYLVKITIYKNTDTESRVPNCVLTTMALSLREVVENPEKLPPTVVHKDLLQYLGKYTPAVPKENTKSRLSWNVKYEIITL